MEAVFHAGTAARAGIMAASLARAGATAAETTLEGRHGFLSAFAETVGNLKEVTADLGTRFLIKDVTRKPYACCGANQTLVELSLSLARQHRIQIRDIAKVVVRESQAAKDTPGGNNAGPFVSQFQAQMSTQFCVAAALSSKPVASYRFFGEEYGDPEVSALAKKVELVEDEHFTFPLGAIEVFMQDGRRYSLEEDALYTLIPTRENMEAKFRELASTVVTKERVDEIIDLVMNLEKVEDVRQLTQRLGK